VTAAASGRTAPWQLPPISHNLNVFDLENIASKQMSKPGWDYYSSGADDEITLRENHRCGWSYHMMYVVQSLHDGCACTFALV
jgi:hypothetical protein